MPPPPPPDDELELLDELEPPPPPPEDDEEDEELEGAVEDELEDDVLEVLGAGELEDVDDVEEFEDVDEPVGDVGLSLSHPIVAARPNVMAPPLSRRRKSRRSASAFGVSFPSIFRSFW